MLELYLFPYNSIPHWPRPDAEPALFLDLDGTLIEIAATPDAVVVPPRLIETLRRAQESLGGAVAIVSGRPLAQIDALLCPLNLPAAGEHGAIIRLPDGRIEETQVSIPQRWIDAFRREAELRPGVLVEIKPRSVAIHYRGAPEYEEVLNAAAETLVAEDDRFEAMTGRKVVEIRARGMDKARAVERLMLEEPFRGRVPLYVGDDKTDEDGFRAARSHGGEGFHVRDSFEGQPRRVREWVESIVAQRDEDEARARA